MNLFIITVVAVLVILATILIASKIRIKGGLILVWGIILAAVGGVIWVFEAYCEGLKYVLLILAIIFAIALFFAAMRKYGQYFMAIIIIIACIAGAYFTYNGSIGDSFIGGLIIAFCAGLCGFTVIAAALALKRGK